MLVSLSNDGLGRTQSIHRLVAKAFISNPADKGLVNHINGVKTDNRVVNLEWVTPQENAQHAHDNKLSPTGKPVLMCNLNGKILKEFPNSAKAGEFLGCKTRSVLVRRCAHGKGKTAYGYKWKYASEGDHS
ncbi:HNH endonuclease [Bacillus thuringiensis]|nr:HNH endonuclease [Bacillus thuringiensis]